MSTDLARYVRQMRYPPLGEEGQRRLADSTVLLVGCGALGSVLADTLVRAGVGKLRLVDRDFLELNNLQRQVLYDEADVAAGIPKAIAAAEKLRRINGQVEIEPHVADFDAGVAESLAAGADLLLDGTDNFETRFLLNDLSVQRGVPWVYGGCIGAEGQSMSILPGETACLTCLMGDAPPPGTTATCDTAGILAPIIHVIASIQATETLKILSGNRAAVSRDLAVVDLWQNRMHRMRLDGLRERGDCPTCGRREFPWLEGTRGSHTAVLCGRNAVQLSFPGQAAVELESLASRLEGVGAVSRNAFLLRAEIPPYRLTVFPDGRAIVQGTEEIAEARSVYARYVGS